MSVAHRKAASGLGTIRKKTVTRNGKTYNYYEARLTTGFDPLTGKQIQRSFTGTTQAEVRRKLQEHAVEVNDGTYVEPSKTTFSEWFKLWLTEFTGRCKPQTTDHYRDIYEHHLEPAFGDKRLDALEPMQIQRFYNALQRPKSANGAGLSSKTIINIHFVLHKALADAVKLDMLKSNPSDKCVLPKRSKFILNPLTEAELKSYVELCSSDELGTMLKFILFTGVRRSEAVGLTWDKVNFEKGTVLIDKQLILRKPEEGGPVLAPVKNSGSRLLQPAPSVMALLREEYDKQARQKEYCEEVWNGWKDEKERKTWFVFTLADGSFVSEKYLRYHHKKIAAAIGRPELRVHDLRHNYAVLSLQNGDDVKTVQYNLGHATAAFTLDVYGHVNDRMRLDSSRRMDGLIQSLSDQKQAAE